MVSKLVSDVGQALAVLDKERGIRMAECMGLAIAKSSRLEKRLPSVLPERAGEKGIAGTPNKKPRGGLVPIQDSVSFAHRQHPLKHLGELLAHIDTPDTVALRSVDAPV